MVDCFAKKLLKCIFDLFFAGPQLGPCNLFFSFIVPTFNELLMEDIQIKYLANATQNISTQRNFASIDQHPQ